MAEPNKISSNNAGLYFAEEETLKTLPVAPVWYELEPNTFSDFGGELSTVARAPFNPSRQRKKGTVTDLAAKGGFNIDITQNNLLRLLQTFFFANAHEKPDTKSINSASIAITSIATNKFNAAAGLGVFLTNHLIFASGFGISSNNGLKVVTASNATSITVASLADEASPPAASRVQVCGYQFPSGDLAATYSSGVLRLTSATIDPRTLGLSAGEWVFIGGDAAGVKFATCPSGYARIKAIAATYIEFDYCTFTPLADAGAGKTVQIFFGTFIKNEADPSNQVTKTIQLERQLGNDGNGIQSEYITGAFANEFTLNIPVTNKLSADLAFVGMDNEQRDGTTGIKTGDRVSAAGEACFNTSSDIYRIRMNVLDPTTANPTAVFGYILEGNIKINNNVNPCKAVGVLGAFDASFGLFEVSGSITAYFATLAGVEAVRENADVCFNFIAATRNAGFVYDIPLLTLGGGKPNVEKDQPIKIPLDMAGAAHTTLNFTLGFTSFAYLPDAGCAQ